MAKRAVVWTGVAIKQRKDIFRYWTLRNGSSTYAEKLIKLIEQRTKLIAKNPELFKFTNFPEVRVSAMGHFSILYKYTEMQLIIVSFWDNRQDPKTLFSIITKKDDE